MNRYELALDYFRKNYNCCQSTLLAFSDVIGLDEQKALDIAGGYGSGAGTGELCGAINGAIMALGLLANAAGFEATDATPAAKEMGLTKHCEIMVVTAVELVEQIIAERDAK